MRWKDNNTKTPPKNQRKQVFIQFSNGIVCMVNRKMKEKLSHQKYKNEGKIITPEKSNLFYYIKR